MGKGETMRFTPQRQAVLAAIQTSRDHLSASDIWERARILQPRISFATVYSAVHYLCNAGMLLEIPFGNGASIYDARTEPHQHAVCSRCGSVADCFCDGADEVGRCAMSQTGFSDVKVHITITGVCALCRAEEH